MKSVIDSKKHFVFFLLTFSLLAIPTAWAQEESSEPEAGVDAEESSTEPTATEPSPVDSEEAYQSIRYSCTLQKLARRVEVDYDDPNKAVPCKVNYYKDSEIPGEKLVLWEANHTEGYCEEKSQNFINQLTEKGWKCEGL